MNKIFKHYKQSPINILNDQLQYKTHTLFNIIIHASHTNISAIPTPMNWKANTIAASSTWTDNVAHDTRKLLLNTQGSEDFA